MPAAALMALMLCSSKNVFGAPFMSMRSAKKICRSCRLCCCLRRLLCAAMMLMPCCPRCLWALPCPRFTRAICAIPAAIYRYVARVICRAFTRVWFIYLLMLFTFIFISRRVIYAWYAGAFFSAAAACHECRWCREMPAHFFFFFSFWCFVFAADCFMPDILLRCCRYHYYYYCLSFSYVRSLYLSSSLIFFLSVARYGYYFFFFHWLLILPFAHMLLWFYRCFACFR